MTKSKGANLKGGSFDKQITNAFYRTLALGEGRHFKLNDNKTHSLELGKKRTMYLNDFKKYLEKNGINNGKINKYMNQENIKDFITERTDNLSAKSALDYCTGFNSLLKGLEQTQVYVPANPSQNDFLKSYREELRSEMRELEVQTGRYIQNLDEKLNELKEINYESYVIARIQETTGLRVAEALEVAKNFENYYDPNTNSLNGIVGKGNHFYQPKMIDYHLAQEIQKIENIPTYSAYREDLKEIGIARSHDIRLSYAKDLFEHKLEQGINYKQALREVSRELNHHRPQMTLYYLNRA